MIFLVFELSLLLSMEYRLFLSLNRPIPLSDTDCWPEAESVVHWI